MTHRDGTTLGERPGIDSEGKIAKAEHEAVMALSTAITERRIDGDLQAWVDTLRDLYAGQDVALWEANGRGRVI